MSEPFSEGVYLCLSRDARKCTIPVATNPVNAHKETQPLQAMHRPNPLNPFQIRQMAASPAAWFWSAAALMLIAVAAVRIAPPDLAFYYSYAHSLLFDLDWNFANQFDRFTFAMHELYLSSQSLPANDWPMGTGIAWLPFLALSAMIRSIGTMLGFPIDAGGYSWFDQWTITFGASYIYGAGMVYLSYHFIRNEGLSKTATLWSSALIALGSSLTYHLYVNSADSHPPSAFFIVLFLLAWQRHRQAPSFSSAILAGAALGLAGLIRPHNMIWGLVPLLELLIRRDDAGRSAIQVRHALTGAAAAAFAFLPQLMVWQVLYGSWLSVPRSGDVRWLEPHLFETLFSDFHGMVSWSPLFGLAMLGLAADRRRWPYLIPLLITIYVYSCNIAWWAGGSFGNRRMVSCAPIFILGLAAFFDSSPKIWIRLFAYLCVTLNFILFLALPESISGEQLSFSTHNQWLQHMIIKLATATLNLLIVGGLIYILRRWITPKVWIKFIACLCAVWTIALLLAEMGGAIRLDHYQPWLMMFVAVPDGLPRGLSAHLTRGEWSQHALERIIGALGVLIALGAAALIARRWLTWTRSAVVTLAALALLNAASLAAALRTPEAALPDELSEYIPRDRFTWVVYFEGGFYHLRKGHYAQATEFMLAATAAEPRHPQPWMYTGIICKVHGQERLAYEYFRQAMKAGGRSDILLNEYLRSVNQMIRRSPTPQMYNERGVILTMMRQYDAALADFRAALAAESDYIPAQENLTAVEQRKAGRQAPLYWE